MLANEVIIRDVNEEDIATIANMLMADLGYPATVSEMGNRFKHIFAHPDYRTLVAVINDEIVGMAGLHRGLFYEHNGMYVRVLAFVVKANSRKLGLGNMLLTACEDWARELGIHTVIINSGNREERTAAHAFYRKMGYEVKSSGFVKQLS